MKRLFAIAILLILTGCAAGNVSITLPDGTKKEASSMSFWLDMKSVKGDFQKETFQVQGSTNSLDLQTILNILQAAAAVQQ